MMISGIMSDVSKSRSESSEAYPPMTPDVVYINGCEAWIPHRSGLSCRCGGPRRARSLRGMRAVAVASSRSLGCCCFSAFLLLLLAAAGTCSRKRERASGRSAGSRRQDAFLRTSRSCRRGVAPCCPGHPTLPRAHPPARPTRDPHGFSQQSGAGVVGVAGITDQSG